MGDYVKKQWQKYKMHKADFYRALSERNFDEMADIYTEIRRCDSLFEGETQNTHFFAEVLEGYQVKIPMIAVNVIRSFGEDYYCILNGGIVNYSFVEIPNEEEEEDDRVLECFRLDYKEAFKGKLTGDVITLTEKAVQNLRLSMGDIVEITVSDCFVSVEKFSDLP